MKSLLINTYENFGGAAIATNRLHKGLCAIGVNSQMMVQAKQTDDYTVLGQQTKWRKVFARYRPNLDAISTKFYRQREKGLFSSAWLSENLAHSVAKVDPDIVHLFWVNGGFMKIETLKSFHRPIIWTLHDMWPFTGGCHYDEECGKFRQLCGNCPFLHSGRDRDLSRRVFLRKLNSWKDVPIVVVATSHWLANMARASSLFKNQRIEVIPNGLDTEKYKPVDKQVARSVYNLPQDKHLILFSAFSATSDKRKGNQFLVPALEKLSKEGWADQAELVIVGASRPENPPDLGMKVHYMGYLQDEASQVLLYSAADVVVAPSMQENLSNAVMESLACGTPVVAFGIGGMPDMIDHQKNGYLAKPFEFSDLANGIMWVLEDKNRQEALSSCARETVIERYTLKSVANRYAALYHDVLN
jgi:glycosyltransferase involved in cell wall biosynthesis